MGKDHFGLWLESQARGELTEKLEVTLDTLNKWARGEVLPTIRNMRRIRKMAKGKVTYEMIIDRPAVPRGFVIVEK